MEAKRTMGKIYAWRYSIYTSIRIYTNIARVYVYRLPLLFSDWNRPFTPTSNRTHLLVSHEPELRMLLQALF